LERVVHSSGFKQDLMEHDYFLLLMKPQAPESGNVSTARRVKKKRERDQTENKIVKHRQHISSKKKDEEAGINLAPCLSDKQSFNIICTLREPFLCFFLHTSQT
jgi:hypothetical protein